MFVGFAPFFILCLMFKKTTPYFFKWLNYGLATMFSSALLAAMASISTDLVRIIAQSQYKYSKIASITSIITGESVTGIFNSAMNQLGLGLMLSTVLIIVPPMAGSWFNGMMSGAYYGANQFERWNNPNGGAAPIGSGAGSGAHGMPAYGNQQQNASYQTNTSQQYSQPSDYSTQRITRAIAINSGQASNPTTSPANSLVGVGNQTRQSEPNNNGGNTNGDLCKKAFPSTAETQTQVFGCFRPQSLLILPKYPLFFPGRPIIRHPGRLLGCNRHT